MAKKPYIALVFMINVFFLAVLFSGLIIRQFPFIAGIDGINRFDIVMRDNMPIPGERYFEPEDIDKIKQVNNVKNAAFSAKTKGLLETGNTKISVEILGVTDNYRYFETFNFISGSFFTRYSFEASNKVIVSNDKLLENAFRNKEIIGAKASLNSVDDFKIIGVVKRNNYLSNILSDDNKVRIYVPFSTLKEIDKSINITGIHVSVIDSGKLYDTQLSVLEVLGRRNMNPDYVRVVRYDNRLKTEKTKFILSFAIIILVLAIPIIKYQVLLIANGVKKEKIRRAGKSIYLGFIKILVCLAVIVGLYLVLIKDHIYVNPGYIPRNMIDFKQYKDAIIKIMSERNANLSNPPNIPEINILRLSRLHNMVIAIGLSSFLFIGIIAKSSRDTHTIRTGGSDPVLNIVLTPLICMCTATGIFLAIFRILGAHVHLSVGYMFPAAALMGVYYFQLKEKVLFHSFTRHKTHFDV